MSPAQAWSFRSIHTPILGGLQSLYSNDAWHWDAGKEVHSGDWKWWKTSLLKHLVRVRTGRSDMICTHCERRSDNNLNTDVCMCTACKETNKQTNKKGWQCTFLPVHLQLTCSSTDQLSQERSGVWSNHWSITVPEHSCGSVGVCVLYSNIGQKNDKKKHHQSSRQSLTEDQVN